MFLRKQASQFAHGRDKALSEFRQETLAQRCPELVTRAFHSVCNSDELPSPGELLYIIPDMDVVAVHRGNEQIGILSPGDTRDALALFRETPECCGILSAVAFETSPLTGEFSLRVKTDGEGEL